MRKPFTAMVAFALMLGNVLPGIPSASPQTASAHASAAPVMGASVPPLTRPDTWSQSSFILPFLDNLPAEVEENSTPATLLLGALSSPASPAETDIRASAVPISITTSGFDPAVVTVTVNTTVEWTNRTQQTVRIQSGEPYRIYLPLVLRSVGGTGSRQATYAPEPLSQAEARLAASEAFSGTIPAGGTFTHTFTTMGNYPYFLANDPRVTGQVIVVPIPFDFALGIQPATQPVTQGQSVTYTVQVTGTLGEPPPVTLTVGGFPTGAAWSLNPATVVPTGTAILSITAGLDTPVGEHTLVITGTSGGQKHAVTATLSVTPQPDFALEVQPLAQGVAQGESVTYTVAVAALYGFADLVALAVNGLPVNTVADWGTNPVVPSATSVLAVTTASDTPTGDYTLVVTGTGGDFTHTADVTLTVRAPAPDLIVGDIRTSPEMILEDQETVITITIRNQGEIAAGSFRTDWYVNPPSPPGVGNSGAVSWTVASLGSGVSVALTTTHVFTPDGDFNLWAQADTLNAVVEGNEANNVTGPVTATVFSTVQQVCGSISEDTIWYSGVVYVVTCDVTVQSGVTLTVQPGAAAKVGAGRTIIVSGTIVADGTESAPITFTGNSDSPAPGYWGAIVLGATGTGSVFDHVRIAYGGFRSGRGKGSIVCDGAPLSMTNSIVEHSGNSGVYIAGSGTIIAPMMHNNQFHNNARHAVYLYVPDGYVTGNLRIAGNSGSGNGTNGIYLDAVVTGTLVLGSNTDLPYIVRSLVVPADQVLELQQGAIVKFADTIGSLTVDGTMLLKGSLANPVVLTSIKDDSYGGDTNNDGNATVPARSDWRAIQIGSGGSAQISHTIIKYGGYERYGRVCAPLDSRGGSLSVHSSHLSDSYSNGICTSGSYLTVTDSTISSSSEDGIYAYQAPAISLSGNTLSDNGGYPASLDFLNGTFVSAVLDSGSGNGTDGILLSGSLGSDTTLPLNPDFAYVFRFLRVNTGVTLRLPAGLVVKMADCRSCSDANNYLDIYGVLVSDGTQASPVCITSIYDDSCGGDTNNDGSSTAPAPGDWGNIRLRAGSSGSLDHTNVRYGGYYDRCYGCVPYSAVKGTINAQDAQLSLTNSTVEYSGGGNEGGLGIYAAGSTSLSIVHSVVRRNRGDGIYLYASGATVNPAVSNNTLSDNTGRAVYIFADHLTSNSSIASNTGSGNGTNGIHIVTTFTGSVSLSPNAQLPYLFDRVTVGTGQSLEIQAGTVLKMMNHLFVDGTLVCNGSSSSQVYFTSVMDDSVGGDTNNDGLASSPARGDWEGVYVHTGGVVTFQHTIMRYGGKYIGYGSPPGVLNIVEDGQATLSHCTISHGRYFGVRLPNLRGLVQHLTMGHTTVENNERGIYASGNPRLSITDSMIRYNELDGIELSYGAQPDSVSITNSSIYGNGRYGVQSHNTSVTINAEDNWWGDPSGPAPYGTGNGINYHTVYSSTCQCYIIDRYYVDADPWLGKDYWVAHHNGQEVDWNTYVAEPVNTANGNYSYQHTDLSIPTRGLPLEFVRSYNSAMPQAGPLGYGWTHSYNITLTENLSDSTVLVQYGDGRQDQFTISGTLYIPPLGTFSVLTKTGTFTLTLKDQTAHGFDAAGRLARIVDRNGNTTVLSYAGGNLTTVTEPAVRVLTFTYDGSNRIVGVTDPLGRSLGFTYNITGELTVLTDTRGFTTTYTYDANHRLTSTTDANGNTFVTNVYNDEGRVVEQYDALGNKTTLTYDIANRKTVVANPLGRQTIYVYDKHYRLIQETDALNNTLSYTYDADNNPVRTVDKRGFTTTLAYDNRGNTTVVTDTLGGITRMVYDVRNNLLSQINPRGATTCYAYDDHSNLAVITDASGYTTSFTYYSDLARSGLPASQTDARGYTTAYDYNAYGHLSVITDTLGYVTRHTYDAGGRLLQFVDARGYTTTYAYDDANHVATVTDTIGAVTHYRYDAAGSRIVITDALGNATHFGYDGMLRLVIVTETLGHTTTYAYDALGNQLSVTDGNGHTTCYGHDALSRVAVVTDALDSVTTYGYDGNGNRTWERDPSGNTTYYAYDALNRMVVITDPLAHPTAYGYDAVGNRAVVTDALGSATHYGYDALNHLTVVTDALGSVTTYGYDTLGNRTTITDANGHVTTQGYDALNRPLFSTDAVSNTARYGYDALDNLSVVTDATGTTINYTYDAANRLTGIQYPASAVQYAYDVLGRRTAMTDTTGVTGYTYDTLGRVLTVTTSAGSIGYGYDAVNRVRLIYPGGQPVTYTYDAADRLRAVMDWAGRVVTYTYNASGQPLSIVYPNGVTTTLTYNAAGWVTAITHTSRVSGTFAYFRYTYDDAGNRLSEVSANGTTTYTYDTLNRLVQVDYPGGETAIYAYDPMGNRTAMTSTTSGVVTYTYDDADRLLMVGLDTFGWDANGNVVTRTYGAAVVTYTWDAANRLTGILTGTDVITYTYDGDGARVGKAVNGVATTYLQDLATSLPQVLVEAAGGQDTLYTYGQDLLTQVDPAGNALYYHADGLGSIRNLSNQGGQVVAAYTYDALGAIRSQTDGVDNPFTFAGEQMDVEGELLFLRARYYDPTVGRFVSRDPFPGFDQRPATLNRYVYVLNDPVNQVDPSGFFGVRSIASAIGGWFRSLLGIPGLQPASSAQEAAATRLSGFGALLAEQPSGAASPLPVQPQSGFGGLVQVANPFYGNVAVVEAPTNNCVTYVRYQRGEVGTPRGNPSTWIPSHPQDTVFRGYDVGRTPRPGALMVEGPNPRAGIGSAGHVSFVDQVRSDGSFHIVEGNWAGGFHDQWFYTDKPSRRAPAVFIYGRHR